MVTKMAKVKESDSVHAIAKRFRRVREIAGFTLQELANLSGLSKSMISKFELGHRDLSPDAVERLKKAIFELVAVKMGLYGLRTSASDLMEVGNRTVRVENAQKDLFVLADKLQGQRNQIIKELEYFSKWERGTTFKEWHDAEVAAAVAASTARDKFSAAQLNFINKEGTRLLDAVASIAVETRDKGQPWKMRFVALRSKPK